MNEILGVLAENQGAITEAIAETGQMVGVAIVAAVLLGLPLGTVIYLTREGGVLENRAVRTAADMYVTIVRSSRSCCSWCS